MIKILKAFINTVEEPEVVSVVLMFVLTERPFKGWTGRKLSDKLWAWTSEYSSRNFAICNDQGKKHTKGAEMKKRPPVRAHTSQLWDYIFRKRIIHWLYLHLFKIIINALSFKWIVIYGKACWTAFLQWRQVVCKENQRAV